jgi:hypothetical protein
MYTRAATARLKDLLGRFPAVCLSGPRQAGKTTLARAIADELGDKATYLDLELPSDSAKLSDPESFLSGYENRLVVLDEIQRAPGVFQALRGIIDQRRRKGIRAGQFLLLGSASIELLKQSAETLAGRISYLELTPLTVAEVHAGGPATADRLWVRGGFPDSFLAPHDPASLDWRRSFIATYLERDIPMLGPRIPAETLGRFWRMLAHNQGQLLNAARLAASLGVSGQTVARYLDIMVDLLLVRRLRPWAANAGKRLVRSPKVYVRDSGVAHALLGIADREDLLGHPVAGESWEGFVIENLVASAPPGTEAWFYRSSAGAEIDLTLQLGARDLWAVEVKRSLSPTPSRGFHVACDDVKATRRLLVYPGTDPYRLKGDVEVVPLTAVVYGGFK